MSRGFRDYEAEKGPMPDERKLETFDEAVALIGKYIDGLSAVRDDIPTGYCSKTAAWEALNKLIPCFIHSKVVFEAAHAREIAELKAAHADRAAILKVAEWADGVQSEYGQVVPFDPEVSGFDNALPRLGQRRALCRMMNRILNGELSAELRRIGWEK